MNTAQIISLTIVAIAWTPLLWHVRKMKRVRNYDVAYIQAQLALADWTELQNQQTKLISDLDHMTRDDAESAWMELKAEAATKRLLADIAVARMKKLFDLLK